MSCDTLKKNISRLVVGLVCLSLVFGLAPVVRAQEGTCGDDLTWSLSGGTLTITGTGAMKDYPESEMAPWYPLRDQILRLQLPQGLTAIGNLAFYECTKLTAVVIPDSVTRIGEYAFAQCTGMELLTLGAGVTAVEACAFSDCVKLTSLRLPDGLQSIGLKGFYRCESIPTVTVPASVTEIGMSAFGYCKSLVTATVNADIDVIPEWMFYGCDLLITVTLPEKLDDISTYAFRGCDILTTVYYNGTQKTSDEIRQMIGEDLTSFDRTGYVTNTAPPETTSSGSFQSNGDGTYTQENITVTENADVTITSKTETLVQVQGESLVGTDTDIQVNVTVNTDSGWDKAQSAVDQVLTQANENAALQGTEVGTVNVNLFVAGAETVSQEFLDTLAGRDVEVTVVTKDGSSWTIDCGSVNIRESGQSYDMRYTLSAAPENILTQMSATQGFLVKFSADANVNAELVITLPLELARQTATLFHQENRRTLVLHQSAVIDDDGNAHFYLGEVSGQVDYYIGINVPGTQEDAIIPQSMLTEYGIDYQEPIQYVITGRQSSWGIGIGTVTWILAAVMLGSIAAVGAVMYAMNKRRLKMGYIPDISEEI